jgi:hypothetical protein
VSPSAVIAFLGWRPAKPGSSWAEIDLAWMKLLWLLEAAHRPN